MARCSAAFGATLIIHDTQKSASVNASVVKASAGTAFRIRFMETESLEAPLKILQKSKYEIVGLDLSEKALNLYQWAPSRPIAMILGSEGEGMEEKARNFCSRLIRIAMESSVDSLNVSHAASIAMSWIQGHA